MFDGASIEFGALALIVLFPVLGALFSGVLGARLPRALVGTVSSAAVGASFVVAIFAMLAVAATGADVGGHTTYGSLTWSAGTWFSAGGMDVEARLVLDSLSTVMVLIITGVGFLIHVYSTAYMADDRGFARYFAYLNLFVAAMLVLVLADNLVLLFLGWEGVGVASYLLIGFWYTDDEKAAAGQKAFIVNRIGDAAVLLGLFILWQLAGSLSIDELRQWASHISLDQLRVDGETSAFAAMLGLVCVLFFIGCTGKSAQLPLYTWLPDAMAGPTPVSALIHAATMVTAGVYLIARMSFLYAFAPSASALVVVVGALTALFAAVIGTRQTDIKKVLAYSTVSQLGFMFAAVGSGAYFAGVFHLMTHAFFKALLFLGAGSVIHGMGGEQDIRKMGGLKAFMPKTRWTFLIGCLAIAGVPPLAGFFSKDEVAWFVLSNVSLLGGPQSSALFGWLFWGVLMLSAALTAYYMFRLYFLVFEGESRAEAAVRAHIHESPAAMTIPLMVLAALSVVGGLAGVPHVLGGPLPLWFADLHGWLYSSIGAGESMFAARFDGSSMAWLSMGAALAVSVAGFVVARSRFGGDKPLIEGEGESKLAKAVVGKFFVDELYDRVIVRPLAFKARVLDRYVDTLGIDQAGVQGVAYSTRVVGNLFKGFQSGDVQRYVVFVLIGLGIILYLLL
jgi:NADH-quinone oxidoreductase subunit L